jgi:hypothetical protein
MRCGPRWFLVLHSFAALRADHRTANAPLSRVVVFRAPGQARLPVFRFPSKRGEWSAGRRPGSLRYGLPQAGSAICQPVRLVRTHGPEVVGPGASRRSIAARIVGGRTLLPHPASRSTTPSMQQGGRTIGGARPTSNWTPGPSTILQHCKGERTASYRVMAASPKNSARWPFHSAACIDV